MYLLLFLQFYYLRERISLYLQLYHLKEAISLCFQHFLCKHDDFEACFSGWRDSICSKREGDCLTDHIKRSSFFGAPFVSTFAEDGQIVVVSGKIDVKSAMSYSYVHSYCNQ